MAAYIACDWLPEEEVDWIVGRNFCRFALMFKRLEGPFLPPLTVVDEF